MSQRLLSALAVGACLAGVHLSTTAASAQQPLGSTLGPNLLHTHPPAKPGTAPAATTPDELRRQQSRVATRQRLATRYQAQKVRVATYLASLTAAQRARQPAGAVLVDIRNGRPLFHIDHNDNAAITSATDQVRNNPGFLDVDGSGYNVGVWEVFIGRSNQHFEWDGRFRCFEIDDWASLHAAHVVGTIAAAGIDPLAMGMAPASRVRGFNTIEDALEMADEAAASPDDFFTRGKLLVSNHSYGISHGWRADDGDWFWLGNATLNGPNVTAVDPGFGQYSDVAADWDQVCWDAPYYLPFKSAGNERDDGPPPEGAEFTYYFEQDDGDIDDFTANYDPLADPPGDSAPKNGYDTLAPRSTAKNCMTVGATEDGVFELGNKTRFLPFATIESFSSWGPTDDGRIKPDIVANGSNVYSTANFFPEDEPVTQEYWSISGTSMATPTACGSAVLLHQYFTARFPGDVMRAATLKGLIIHTADDLGNPGPDYVYGWGMMNTERAAQQIAAHAEEVRDLNIFEGTVAAGTPATVQFCWNQQDNPVHATICWTDPAGPARMGTDNRSRCLVNDIDIDIQGPAGTSYDQYVLDVENPAAVATTGDNDVDNVRQIRIEDPVPGIYTLTIRNDGPFQGDAQPYSLFLSGQLRVGLTPTPFAVRQNRPYTQSFEGSALPLAADGWTYASTGAGRISNSLLSLFLDDASADSADSATNTAAVHLDLAGREDVFLEFDWRDYNETRQPLPVSTTNRTFPGDGVMFSLDGDTWYRVTNLPLETEDGWNTEVINLDNILALHGFTPADYTDNVRIRFFQHGSERFPLGGLQIAEVRAYLRSPGEFSLEITELAHPEQNGPVPVTVHRHNGTDGEVSVQFDTTGLTATAGSDFANRSLTLGFADGEASKSVNIPVNDDNQSEPTERLRVTLSNPTGEASLGDPRSLVVRLIDDDEPPVLTHFPSSLKPVTLHGTDAAPQSLMVRNTGGGVLRYEVMKNAPWITVEDAEPGAVTEGEHALATISLQTADLLPGRHSGSVRIVDTGGHNPAAVIPVDLLVGFEGETVTRSFTDRVNVPAGSAGRATVYPVTIDIPQTHGRTHHVQLRLAELSHGNPADLDITVTSPDGIPVAAFSDAGGSSPVVDINLVLSPTGLALRQNRPLVSNTPYAAANFGATDDQLPTPAPALPLAHLGDLNGGDPAGTWEVFVADDTPPTHNGSIETISLRIRTAVIEDVFAERFTAGTRPFDLAHSAVVFTPHPTSPQGYTAERFPLAELPSPVAGATVKPEQDGYIPFDLTGRPVRFYGREYTRLFIGENGDIGIGSAPTSGIFATGKRIAPFHTDLDLHDGTISVDERANRVVLTYAGVREVSTGATVSFQVEIFHDGRIRITYGDIPAVAATVGLSRGDAQPWSTNFTNLSNAPDHGIEIVADHLDDGIVFGLAWTSQPGVLYEVRRSRDGVTWNTVDTVHGSPGTATVWAVPNQRKAGNLYQVRRTSRVTP